MLRRTVAFSSSSRLLIALPILFGCGLKVTRRYLRLLVGEREGLRLAIGAIEKRELLRHLVADDDRRGGQVPACTGLAAGLHLDGDRFAPDVLVRQHVAHDLENLHAPCRLLENLKLALRRPVDRLDLGLALLGLSAMRLQHLVPRPLGIAVVAAARTLPLGRHTALVRELAKFLR